MGTVQPIPCLLSMPTRNHMDITTPPLPPVAPEVLRVAEHRHKKGLMYPYIFHVLTKVRRLVSVLTRQASEMERISASQAWRERVEMRTSKCIRELGKVLFSLQFGRTLLKPQINGTLCYFLTCKFIFIFIFISNFNISCTLLML